MTTNSDLTRRSLFGVGAASFGALALGADAVLAAEPAAPTADDVSMGGAPARLVESFPELAPPAVSGATMATKSSHDAIGYVNAGTSTLTWVSASNTAVYAPGGVVLCSLDVPAGGRIVQIDYYGWRGTAGTQTWRLLRLDATTDGLTVPNDITSPSGTNQVVQTSLTGIDLLVEPGIQYVADLLGSNSINNAFVSVVYQYIPPGLLFHPLTPFRAYDSRWPGAGGPLLSNTSRTVSVKDAHDTNTGAVTTADLVPPAAQAITYNLTITGTSGSGFLAITPGDEVTFGASAINWSSTGQDLANGGTVGVNAAREVKVFAGFTGSTQFIVDVTGYYS